MASSLHPSISPIMLIFSRLYSPHAVVGLDSTVLTAGSWWDVYGLKVDLLSDAASSDKPWRRLRMNECDPEAGCDWEEGNRGGREFNGLRVTVCVCVCVWSWITLMVRQSAANFAMNADAVDEKDFVSAGWASTSSWQWQSHVTFSGPWQALGISTTTSL